MSAEWPRELTAAFGILEEEGRLLLVAEWRRLGAEPELCWDVPGGGVEEGESLEEAVIREFREETGLDVAVTGLAFVIERFGFRSEDPTRRSRFFFFHVARRGGDLRPADAEIVDTAFQPWDRVSTICTQWYHAEFRSWIAEARQRSYFVTVRDPEARAARRNG